MTSKPQPAGGDGLPVGYAAVPIELSPPAAGAVPPPVRVCVLVRHEPDPVAGRFILVRQTPAARAFLACLTDAAQNLIDWLELWIETPPSTGAAPGWDEDATNAQTAARWDALVSGLTQLGKIGGLWVSGWEQTAGRPLVLEPDGASGFRRIGPLIDAPSGMPWTLCTDESVLSAAGLPGYASSPHRYLSLSGQGAQSPLIAATPGAPQSPNTAPLPTQADGKPYEPFNLPAGRMFLRRHGPIPLTAMLDVLAGRPWRGLGHGAGTVRMGGGVEALRTAAASEGDAAPDTGRLFLGRHGRRGRVVESFHLRLRLLADMVAAVRLAVSVTGRPLLSLGPDSFQLRLPEPASGLPFLWAAELSLADSGTAIQSQVPGSELYFFHLPGTVATSIYRPQVQQLVGGDCVVRVRTVTVAEQGAVVEGTIATPERIKPADGQLLRLRLSLGSGPIDLYGRLEGTAPAAGEWRFRTVGQRLPAQPTRELQAAAGVPLAGVPFGIIPTAGPASDLYSLGVLAVQALLADEQTFPLPVALDEVMSLARQLAEQHDPEVGAGLRLRSIVETTPKWLKLLGPHRLMPGGLSPEEAAEMVPGELWWDTLAAILRMFPEVGPDSICPTWGDATADVAPHRVFDPTLADLDGLIRRSRSLIVIDWQFNREIRAAIDARLQRQDGNQVTRPLQRSR